MVSDRELEAAIDASSVPKGSLPRALPFSHLTIARWFDSIVDAGVLRPTHCSVFQSDRLYFFYGGVFYRTGNGPTRERSELPVAFLFEPPRLTDVDEYFPYDTGAARDGRLDSNGLDLADFQRFSVRGRRDHRTASRIVHALFGSNRNYVDGIPRANTVGEPEVILALRDVLRTDQTPLGVDRRHAVIECQLQRSFDLVDGLDWIGFPHPLMPVFERLCAKSQPRVPRFHPYRYHATFHPHEIAAQLEHEAFRHIRRYLEDGVAP